MGKGGWKLTFSSWEGTNSETWSMLQSFPWDQGLGWDGDVTWHCTLAWCVSFLSTSPTHIAVSLWRTFLISHLYMYPLPRSALENSTQDSSLQSLFGDVISSEQDIHWLIHSSTYVYSHTYWLPIYMAGTVTGIRLQVNGGSPSPCGCIGTQVNSDRARV